MDSLVKRTITACIGVVLLSLAVAGCGGSGGGIGGTGKQIMQDGLVVGVVEGFGSIVINDKRFETDDAVIAIDGRRAQLSDLSIGMGISAGIDSISGEAVELRYQPDVAGPVQSLDTVSKTITVLGQQIRYSDTTVFDGLVPEALAAGQMIEVSGNRNASQAIVAGYIRSAAGQEMYTVGIVEYSGANNEVQIGGVRLDVSSAALAEGLSNADYRFRYLPDRALVRVAVKGNPVDGAVIVESVDQLEQVDYKAGDTIQMLGIVSATPDENTYRLGGFDFSIDEETKAVGRFGTPLDFPDHASDEPVIVDGIAEADNGAILMTVVRFLNH